jgi:integrase
MLEAVASLKEVQERLGHSSIKITGDIYAHVTPLGCKKKAHKSSVNS